MDEQRQLVEGVGTVHLTTTQVIGGYSWPLHYAKADWHNGHLWETLAGLVVQHGKLHRAQPLLHQQIFWHNRTSWDGKMLGRYYL